MKKHAIITACNDRYADFLISQWSRSLFQNVNLDNTDVIVLDYGLNSAQKQKISKLPLTRLKRPPAAQIVSRRFIDAGKFLANTRYDQVLLIDGGDIIFQKDISFLFEKYKDSFRAVALDLEVLFNEIFLPGSFTKTDGLEIYNLVKNKEVINAGFVMGPKEKIVMLGNKIDQLVADKNRYGPDQIAVNYVLYRSEVKLLARTYNYMVNNVREKIQIRNGLFYATDGKIIHVVHNAGHKGALRPVLNFGYGPGYNRLNSPIYEIKRHWYRNLRFFKPLAATLLEKYLSS